MKSIASVVGLCATLFLNPMAMALSCGDTVTTSITLTEDLTGCPDVGLHIAYSNSITIDLNGHSITGASGSSVGIAVLNSKGSRILNGDISGFSTGIAANYSRQLTISEMYLADFGEAIYLFEVTQSHITHSYFDNNFNGVAIDSSGGLGENEISGNGVYDNNNGITLAANNFGVASSANRVVANKLYENEIGVVIYGPNTNPQWNKYNRIERNAIRGGTTGIDISGNRNYRTRIIENSFYQQSGRAIEDTGTRTELTDNRCSGIGSC